MRRRRWRPTLASRDLYGLYMNACVFVLSAYNPTYTHTHCQFRQSTSDERGQTFAIYHHFSTLPNPHMQYVGLISIRWKLPEAVLFAEVSALRCAA